jgi:hypothetical protein
LKKEEVRTWRKSFRISSSKCRRFKASVIRTLMKRETASVLMMMMWGLAQREPNVWMVSVEN